MLRELGVIGVLITVLIILFLPLILTVTIGMAIANALDFTGFVWWAFVILFYLIIGSILTKGAN